MGPHLRRGWLTLALQTQRGGSREQAGGRTTCSWVSSALRPCPPTGADWAVPGGQGLTAVGSRAGAPFRRLAAAGSPRAVGSADASWHLLPPVPPPGEDRGVRPPLLLQPGRRRRADGAAGGLLDGSPACRQEERGGEEGPARHQKHAQVHLPVSPGQQAAQQWRGRGHAHHVHDRGHQGEEQEG